jgi:hypothetical protein
MSVNFAELSLCYSAGFLTCGKISRRGTDRFIPLPQEAVLRVFVALESPSSSAESEPESLGFNAFGSKLARLESRLGIQFFRDFAHILK